MRCRSRSAKDDPSRHVERGEPAAVGLGADQRLVVGSHRDAVRQGDTVSVEEASVRIPSLRSDVAADGLIHDGRIRQSIARTVTSLMAHAARIAERNVSAA
jgi:hypothetical protein